MKIIVEISAEELRESKERAENLKNRRLPVAEWVAKDLAETIAGSYTRSQRAFWVVTDIFRPIILEQLTGLDQKKLHLLKSSPDNNVMPQEIRDPLGLPPGSTYQEGREALVG
jgi:hypothetical protein